MKRVIGSISATIFSLVLLLGFKTHAPDASTTLATKASSADEGASTSSATASRSSSSSVDRTTGTSPPSTTTTTKSSAGNRTITGRSVSTRWGPVQVKVTMSGPTITAIDVVEYPQSNDRDIAINSEALPMLVSQAMSVQSAAVDGVSGATYTTTGFIQSLQSALSKA